MNVCGFDWQARYRLSNHANSVGFPPDCTHSDLNCFLTKGARGRTQLWPKILKVFEPVNGSLVGQLTGVNHMSPKITHSIQDSEPLGPESRPSLSEAQVKLLRESNLICNNWAK